MNKGLGTLLTLISATGFGLMVVFAKMAYGQGVNIVTLLSMRFLIAAVIMWIVMLAGRQSPRIGVKRILAVMALGGIGYGLESSLLFGAARLIPASVASLLFYTYPVIVTVLSAWVFRERFTVHKFLSLGISLAGLVLVAGIALQGLNLAGILCSLGAAVVFSVYLITGNRLLSETEPLVMTTYLISGAAVVYNTIGLVTGSLILPARGAAWLPIVGVAVFSTTIGMLALFAGMNLIGPSRTAIISTIEPVVTVGAAWLLLAEHLSPVQMAGGGLVILAVILLQTEKESKGTEEGD